MCHAIQPCASRCGVGVSETICVRADMIQTFSINLKPEHRLRVYARLLAKKAKDKWGDRLIAPTIDKYSGVRSKRMRVDGVPMRFTAAYDMREFELLRRIDVMGYPPEAVLE